jgi:hypothetical protein
MRASEKREQPSELLEPKKIVSNSPNPPPSHPPVLGKAEIGWKLNH